MLIKVTKDDIQQGRRFNSSTCPVALAITRATKVECSVSPHSITIFSQPRKNFKTPSQAASFISNFDLFYKSWLLRKLFCRPFTFELK